MIHSWVVTMCIHLAAGMSLIAEENYKIFRCAEWNWSRFPQGSPSRCLSLWYYPVEVFWESPGWNHHYIFTPIFLGQMLISDLPMVVPWPSMASRTYRLVGAQTVEFFRYSVRRIALPFIQWLGFRAAPLQVSHGACSQQVPCCSDRTRIARVVIRRRKKRRKRKGLGTRKRIETRRRRRKTRSSACHSLECWPLQIREGPLATFGSLNVDYMVMTGEVQIHKGNTRKFHTSLQVGDRLWQGKLAAESDDWLVSASILLYQV